MQFLTKYKTQILLLFAFVYLLIEAQNTNDFDIFYAASNDLFQGVEIYNKLYAQWYHYLYSLLFTLVLFPLTFLPVYVAKLIWLCLNLFLLFRIQKIIRDYFLKIQLSEKKTNWILFLLFIFSLRFIRDNFHLAQMTIFILYSIVEGMDLIWKKKEIQGAALLALGINIKLMPLVFLPYLFWKGYFKAFSLTVFFILIYFFIPIVILGPDNFFKQIHSWWNLINPSQTKHIIDTEERSFHSLTTLIPTLFMENVPDQFALPIKRNLANLSVEQVNKIILLFRLFLIVLTLFFIGFKPFEKEENSFKNWRDLSYLCLIIPLIFPHQQFYAFLLCIPAVSCLLIFWHSMQGNKNTLSHITFVSLLLVYLCFNLSLLLGEFNAYYEHFKIITYGALLIVIVLILNRKNKIFSRNTI